MAEAEDGLTERSDEELRAWMASGSPITRLRAAWTLAERLGIGNGRDRFSFEDGTRSMLSALASDSEIEILSTIAAFDPEPKIRAASGAWLARRAEFDVESAQKVVERLASDGDFSVRAAIIDALPDACPEGIRAIVSTLIADVSRELRRAAMTRVLAWSKDQLGAALAERALRETDAGLRGMLLEAWIARRGAASLLRAIGEAPVTLVSDALARVGVGAVQWSDLAPLAARNLAVFDPFLMPHAVDIDDAAVRSFLVAVVTRAVDPSSQAYMPADDLPRTLAQLALARLAPVLDEPPGPDPVVDVLGEVMARVLTRADVNRFEPAERVLVGYVGRIRYRLAEPDPRGWFGAALYARRDGVARTVIEHTEDEMTSCIVIAATKGLELRAPASAIHALGAALPDPVLARALGGLGDGRRQVDLDPGALGHALARALPPRPELAQDVHRIARIAAARGARVRAEFIEGWLDAYEAPPDRATDVEDVDILERSRTETD